MVREAVTRAVEWVVTGGPQTAKKAEEDGRVRDAVRDAVEWASSEEAIAVKEAVIKAKEASARAEAAIGQHETPAPPLVRVKLIPETASTPFEPPMPEEKLESPFEPPQPSPALDSPQPWAQPGVQAARELALRMQQETEAAVREAVARAAVEWAASGEATAVKEAMAKAKAAQARAEAAAMEYEKTPMRIVHSSPEQCEECSPNSLCSELHDLHTHASARRQREPLPTHPHIEQTYNHERSRAGGDTSNPALYDGWHSPHFVEMPQALIRALLLPQAKPLAPARFEPTRFVLLAAYEACHGPGCALHALHEQHALYEAGVRSDGDPNSLHAAYGARSSQFLPNDLRRRLTCDLFWRLVGLDPKDARKQLRGLRDSDLYSEAAVTYRRARVMGARVPSQPLRRWLAAMPDTLEALGLGQQTLRIMEERGVQAVSPTSAPPPPRAPPVREGPPPAHAAWEQPLRVSMAKTVGGEANVRRAWESIAHAESVAQMAVERAESARARHAPPAAVREEFDRVQSARATAAARVAARAVRERAGLYSGQ